MRHMVLLLAVLAGVGFGAYSSTAVNINHGWGYGTGTPATAGPAYTFANPQYTIGCSGTLTTFKTYLRTNTAGGTVGSAKIKILYNDSGYKQRSSTDITAQVNALSPGGFAAAANNYTLDVTGLSIAVQSGDVVAFYADSIVRMMMLDTGVMDYYSVSGDNANITDSGNNYNLHMQYTISTADRIIYDSSTGWTGANMVYVPTYNTSPYYIVLKDVNCPDTETLQIKLNYTGSTGADATEETYTIDFSSTGTITDDAATSLALAGQAGDKIDYFIYVNPTTAKQDLLLCNYTDGQGGQGDKDISHKSLNSRGVANITAANKIRRIQLVNAGGNAKIGRVVVCREPVVMIGDSFTSSYYPDFTYLDGTGARLAVAGVFTEKRYVINGGIAGNAVLTASTGNYTSILNRWDSTGQDLCGYKDVIYCFNNGPGLNDVAGYIQDITTANNVSAKAYQIASSVLTMASKVKITTYYNNDVILCGMIPYRAHTGAELTNEQQCQKYVNELLLVGAYRMGIPFVDVWSYGYEYSRTTGTHTGETHATIMTDSTKSFTPDAYIGFFILNTTTGNEAVITDNDGTTVTVESITGGWSEGDVYAITNRTHPSTADYIYIADRIVHAYEHNQVPSNPFNRKSTPFGSGSSPFGN